MKWWFRCQNMRCAIFNGMFVARYRMGQTVRCPQCGKRARREERYNDPESSDEDSQADDESSDDEYVHRRVIRQDPVTKFRPRCEFHTRLHGTTPYPMEQSKYWNTYARSGKARTKKTYDALGVKKQANSGGHYAKTGTYENVFGYADEYGREVRKKRNPEVVSKPKTQTGYVYDHTLRYRHDACTYIRSRLAETRKSVVANCDFDYPCLLVQTPGGPTLADFPGNAKKLETNRGHWTKLVMACFVGITNYYAWSLGIPIEMVMRSSFGHLSPSVADCTISYRINVGIVPIDYLDVIVNAIIKVDEIFTSGFKKSLQSQSVSSKFGAISEDYFVGLLLRRINANRKEHNKELEDGEEELDLLTKPELENLLEAEGEDHVKDNYLVGKQILPKKLGEAENLWDWLWSPGDGSGKTVLTQITDRDQEHLEAIADSVMQAIGDPVGDVSGFVKKLSRNFELSDKDGVTVVPLKMLERKPFEHYSPFGQRKITDEGFWRTIQLIMSSLVGTSEGFAQFANYGTIGGLYGYLDILNEHFIVHEASALVASCKDGEGSDSEEEGDLKKGGKIYSKKLITASGMRSIHLAHYIGRACAADRALDVTSIKVSSDQMYYETTEAIGTVPIEIGIKGQQARSKSIAQMLFFDLNHCNNKQIEYPAIDFGSYDIVILDHTSATTSTVNWYLNEAFASKRVIIVVLVTAGLKNEQSGGDMNTYGCIRIMTRDKALRNDLYDLAKKAEGVYKHPKESHAVRKAYKARGFVPTTKTFINPNTERSSTKSSFVPHVTPEFRYRPFLADEIVFDVIPIEPDGDCLFSAMAEVTGRSGAGQAVRGEIHGVLNTNRGLVPDGMYLQIGLGFSSKEVHSKDEYLNLMKHDLVWGGLPEIRAFSRSRPIIVFEDPRTPRLFVGGVEVPIDWSALPHNVVYIAFEGNHYVALRRR